MSDASSQESSVRSDMFIVSPPRLDRAPSGAACSDRRRAVRHMPLLAELKNRMVALCFYKHAAPDGATARAPLLEIARPVHFLILTLLALAAVQTRAEDVASAFQSANRLYEENKFAEAASAYEKLVESGKATAALYFNLGNALFKSGQIGRAIVAYREAEQLAPRDPDVRANLQFARNQAQGPTLPPSRWQRWLGRLTINEWTMLASGTIWAWLMLLAVLQWKPSWKQAMRGWAAGLAGAAGLFCLCLAGSLYESHADKTVIVVARDVIVRHGPLDESQTAFTAQDGAELRVLDQKDEWLEVSDGGSRLGWLRRDKVLAAPGV